VSRTDQFEERPEKVRFVVGPSRESVPVKPSADMKDVTINRAAFGMLGAVFAVPTLTSVVIAIAFVTEGKVGLDVIAAFFVVLGALFARHAALLLRVRVFVSAGEIVAINRSGWRQQDRVHRASAAEVEKLIVAQAPFYRGMTRPSGRVITRNGSSFDLDGTSVDSKKGKQQLKSVLTEMGATLHAPVDTQLVDSTGSSSPLRATWSPVPIAAQGQPDFPPPSGPPPMYDPSRYAVQPPRDWPPLPSDTDSPRWLPDPTGRSAYRYFNGEQWTDWVCGRHGGISVSQLPEHGPS
jgi:hypothetical protein